MSESREYVSQPQENGAVHISEEVLASVARSAAMEVESVSGLTARKGAPKGVRIVIGEDNGISVDCFVLVKLGQNVLEAARDVQKAVESAVESVTGLTVAAVNVTVAGVALPKETTR